MALMVNPANGAGNSERGDRKVRPGRKVLMPVGIDYQDSRAGNRMAIVRFICLKDLEEAGSTGGDVGAYAWDTFVLTERALWKIAKYSVAVGLHEPFDAENEAELQKVLTRKWVIADMKIDKDREGVERVRAAGYYPYSGESEESWDGLVSTGEERHAEYRKWKASQGARPKIVSAPSVSDDEIPF
jgi:hypothetical protein